MRLRLSVHRHALPPVDLLWTVSDEQKALSVAKLLDDVNHIIPLEAEHWGLEDYVVEVDGYECLHFFPVFQVMKDEDQVCIRSLETPEVRARTLAGRHQISEDGRHLIDGIPYGRPYLRHPRRPAIRIPPPKKQRIAYHEDLVLDNDDDEARNSSGEQRIIPYEWKQQLEEAGDDEDDMDYELGQSRRRKRSVRFQDLPASQALVRVASSDEDDDTGDEFQPSSDEEMISSSADSGSDSDSSEVSDDSADEDSSSVSSESDPEESSDSSEDLSEPEEISSKIVPRHQKAKAHNINANTPVRSRPGHGLGRTFARNKRRRESNKLAEFKKLGMLGINADFQDLKAYEAADRSDRRGNPEGGDAQQTRHEPRANDQPELERIRAQLLEAVGRSGLDVTDDILASGINVRKRKTASTETDASAKQHEETTERSSSTLSNGASAAKEGEIQANMNAGQAESTPSGPTPKRARLDIAGSRRMVFGSLGVRPPKTKEDEDKLKDKWMKRGRPAKKLANEEQKASIASEPIDPDAWKSKINLTAFECVNEGMELEPPPFPFKQHWHRREKRKAGGTNGRKGKRRMLEAKQYYDNGAKTYGEFREEVSALNYDEEVTEETPEQGENAMDIDSAVQSQLELEVAAEDDLPPLPVDLSTLPALTRDEGKAGAIIVFKRLILTGTGPAEVTCTALVEAVNDGILHLQLAKRDVPQKETEDEEHGKHSLGMFRMEGMEDEGVDDRILDLPFEELENPMLLKAADAITETPDIASGKPKGDNEEMQDSHKELTTDVSENVVASKELVAEEAQINIAR